MTPGDFVSQLSEIELPNVFNPYKHRCAKHDLDNAPKIRRSNLAMYLECMDGASPDIWIGRDLGYRGGRRTGIALTDEPHLGALSQLTGISVSKATATPPAAERTAAVTWRVIARMKTMPFLWNVFPFHPHEALEQMTNRPHTRAERKFWLHLLDPLLEILSPAAVVAIGGEARVLAHELGLDPTHVRHPSFGGQAEFLRQIGSIYGLGEALDAAPAQLGPTPSLAPRLDTI